MKKITPTVFRTNIKTPLIISGVINSVSNGSNPPIFAVTGPSGIPSVTSSIGNCGTIIGPFQPPRNNTVNNAANA